jgi:predicted enzyme related to lactoylglutathione lyase
MANKLPLIVYPAKNLEATKKFFSTYLATEPYIDGEYYVGYKLSDMEVGLDPNGTAVISYIDTDDIAASLKTLQEVGANVTVEPKDVGGGLLIAKVTVDGNILGLRQEAR